MVRRHKGIGIHDRQGGQVLGCAAVLAALAWASSSRGQTYPPHSNAMELTTLANEYAINGPSGAPPQYAVDTEFVEGYEDTVFDQHGNLLFPSGPVSPFLLPSRGPRAWREPPGPHEPPPPTYSRCLSRLGFRHSYTHGRHVGWGRPLTGTSWLNRPYYYGLSLGVLFMTRDPAPGVARDTDVIGSLLIGCDWDHYWGSEFEYAYATPELSHIDSHEADRNDRLAQWSYSLMYYPWGDSEIRPYWRFGSGNTKFDFPDETGDRQGNWLLTFPIGLGVKYPIRRWMATRVEVTDNFSVGSEDIHSQHNLTLTFGLECRYGAQPKSYWPWNPSRFHR